MEGSELTSLVCTQCPCLRDLNLLIMLVDASNLSVRSESLQSLWFSVWKTRQLEIVAPRLEKLSVSNAIDEARISALKLAELSNAAYDPRCHQFDVVGHRLRLLELGQSSTVASLMQQFDEVDELKLGISIPQGIDGYESFLNATNKLPKCKILSISSAWEHHGLVPGMLHLLRSCNSTRKLSLFDCCDSASKHPCLPSCPCRLEQSHRIDAISLNSLEEVVMKHRMNSAPPPSKEVREKIRRMFQPNIEVELYVFSDSEWVRMN
uniref:FBD domain-containing protein n=2 Tax=Setaria viridis TaxID=4556 RepID=A0A4U6VBA2_SETVI|nr:uncharacterized protein LOC117850026 [Setaria viridis]TKW25073.1 hypothetical protein SEVIR_3G092650v2 [Setaria viridis]